MSEFFQDGPSLSNTYESDALLRSYLKRRLPEATLREIEPGLRALGGRAVGDVQRLGDQAEREMPVHVPYDPWGRRIDQIRVSDAWTALDRISAEEKLVGTAYERKHGEHSRVHQFARVYLFHPSSAIYTCPLAMTDGAARAIELYGDAELKAGAFRRLISGDPDFFWTSGQWMTERTGGSDVSGTSTLARRENGEYRLYGTKWFTSATTSQMAMTLARIVDSKTGEAAQGSRGLSLFYLELRGADGMLNGIRVNRLKDKLGTKALPTAELTLDGARARLVGGEGDGVKKISSLFNITRIWNSMCAIGYMRRGVMLAKDYARRRSAFGSRLSENPLHLETLAAIETETQAAFHMAFRVAELLGKEECGKATEAESAMLRILTPIVKLYTAKQAIAVASEVLESFGGAGYIEDTGLPRLLRDSQVLSIWEGTTNVLSMDMLRAAQKEGALEPLLAGISAELAGARAPELAPLVGTARAAVAELAAFAQGGAQAGGRGEPEALAAGARAFAFSLARTFAASLLISHAEACARGEFGAAALAAARRWCRKPLVELAAVGEAERREARELLGS